MLPSEDYQECHSPDVNLDYPPILMPRNSSYDKREAKVVQNTLVERFKLKLRHTSTLPIYNDSNDQEEEEVKKEKPVFKSKKTLKLVTNTKIDEDMEKSKSFSPQPNTNTTGGSINMHMNIFSFLPNKNLKRNLLLPQCEEYHYFEEFFDVTTKKGSLKHQQDKVFRVVFLEQNGFFISGKNLTKNRLFMVNHCKFLFISELHNFLMLNFQLALILIYFWSFMFNYHIVFFV